MCHDHEFYLRGGLRRSGQGGATRRAFLEQYWVDRHVTCGDDKFCPRTVTDERQDMMGHVLTCNIGTLRLFLGLFMGLASSVGFLMGLNPPRYNATVGQHIGLLLLEHQGLR